MSKIRVLVVDDAVVVRKLVTDVLSADPDIEVVGVAANGKIALQKIVQVAPDLVTLDIEMPEMDGLTTITEIRKTWARLPVIMFSTLTERGASATMDALSRGATDYVTKPANVGSVTVAQQRVREDLIPRIKALCGRAPVAIPRLPLPPRPAATSMRAAVLKPPVPVGIVAIGSSTGGPNALADVIPLLPANFPVPVVITQHMPPMFTRLLAERLSGMSPLTVKEATEGAQLTPGSVWIAPGDCHLVLRKLNTSVIATLTKGPPENSCRPAVDVMLRSVVTCYGGAVLSVILTGMGQDGMRGCEAVREAGGSVLAQDEATSVVWGMPGFVVRAQLANAVLPLASVAQGIIDRVMPPQFPDATFRSTPTTAARPATTLYEVR